MPSLATCVRCFLLSARSCTCHISDHERLRYQKKKFEALKGSFQHECGFTRLELDQTKCIMKP